MCVKNSSVFIVRGNDLYYSSNYGYNWVKYATPVIPGGRVEGLMVFKNKLYLCRSGKVYNSSNNGISWNELQNQPDFAMASSSFNGNLFFNDNDEYLYINNGPSRTNSDQSPWQNIPIPSLPGFGINCLEIIGSKIYLGGWGLSFVSDKNNILWKPILSGADVTDFLAVDSKIYSASTKGLMFTADEGKTWQKSYKGLYANSLILEAFINNNDFWASSHKTSNMGDSWELCLPDTMALLKCKDSLYVTMVKRYTNKTLYYYVSNDDGKSWTPSDLVSDYPIIYIANKKIFWNKGNGLYRSDDFGKTWIKKFPSCFGLTNIENTIFINDKYGIYKSENNGDTWINCDAGINFPVPDDVFGSASLYTNGKDLFYFYSKDPVYRSVDKGDNWLKLPNNGLNGERKIGFSCSNDRFFLSSFTYTQGGWGRETITYPMQELVLGDTLWRSLNATSSFFANNSIVHWNYLFAFNSVTGEGGIQRLKLFEPVNIHETGIDSLKNLIIFPNPAQDYFSININRDELIQITLFDYMGSMVKSEVVRNSKGLKIQVANVPDGFYLIYIKGEGLNTFEKILIQH